MLDIRDIDDKFWKAIEQEEYTALKGKKNGGSKAKVSKEEETGTDEQEVVRESESGSEEEV